MRLADWRYGHLKYSADVQDRLDDAAARCAMDCRIGQPAQVDRFFSFGVIEAQASMVEVAPGVFLPRAAVVVWTHPEHLEVVGLLGEMQP